MVKGRIVSTIRKFAPRASDYPLVENTTRLRTDDGWKRTLQSGSTQARADDAKTSDLCPMGARDISTGGSCMDETTLFDSVASEPCKIVFANPPPALRQSASTLTLSSSQGGSVDSLATEENETPVGSDPKTGPFQVLNLDTGELNPLLDNHLTEKLLQGHADPSKFIRNLDTGELYHLDESPFSCISPYKSCKGCNSGPVRRPWQRWWASKQIAEANLLKAAESGAVGVLADALKPPLDGLAPVDVNVRSLHGRTCLHVAAAVGNADCLDLLLNHGADIEAQTDAGLTAFHVACQRGHMDCVLRLLEWGADALVQCKNRNLPIHMAARHGHGKVVKLILDRGEAPRDQLQTRNSFGQRPAETSLDIDTAAVFRQFEAGLSKDSGDSPNKPEFAADLYAGRRPFYKGSVLPHNSRADMVSKLLHKTRVPPSRIDSMEMPSPTKSVSSTASTRPPFARVRTGAIDVVGPESFDFVAKLGKGSFGEVFSVRHKKTGNTYAMKIMRKSKVTSGNLLRYTVTERNVLSYMNHPYIVSLHFAFQTSHYLVLVMQFCNGGNLQTLISNEGQLPESKARLYEAEVLLALAHLHERNIVYRDLKPENVVLDEDGHSVLTDFGLSKTGVMQINGTRSFCGSVAFLAPEILRRLAHGHTVDIYGLGVLLHCMLAGVPPFFHPDKETLFIRIQHAELRVPSYVSASARSLIEALMNREPSKRLGAAATLDVKHHPFFSSIDFEALMSREVPVPSFPVAPRSPSGSLRGCRQAAENPFRGSRGPRQNGEVDVSGWYFAAVSEASYFVV